MTGGALPRSCCPDEPATLWFGPDGVAAYLGPALGLAPHSGSVACFVVGVDAPFTLRAADRERTVRSALVPARTTHHLAACSGRMLFVHAEPGSARAEHLRRRMTDRAGPVLLAHDREADVVGRAARPGPPDLAALLAAVAPDDRGGVVDPRVRLALRALRDDPDRTATALAARVGLSPSRFLHLFSAGTGTSFRRYRMWARVLRVAGALSRGDDLTTAAADAGFASPSHLSDTVRRMFGLSATALLAGPVRLVVGPAER